MEENVVQVSFVLQQYSTCSSRGTVRFHARRVPDMTPAGFHSKLARRGGLSMSSWDYNLQRLASVSLVLRRTLRPQQVSGIMHPMMSNSQDSHLRWTSAG